MIARMITILILISPWLAMGQQADFKLTMKKAKEAIIALGNVEIISNYQLYATHTSTKPMSSTISKTYMTGNKYYQVIEDVHTIIDGQKIAIVDRNEEQIAIDRKDFSFIDLMVSMDMDAIIDAATKIVKTPSSSLDIYEINFPWGDIEKMIVKANKKTNLLNEIIIFYGQSQGLEDRLADTELPKLVINIQSYTKVNQAAVSWDQNPYFVHDGKQGITLKSSCKNYFLINNLKGK